MIRLQGARIVTPAGVVEGHALAIEAGRIIGLAADPAPATADVVELGGGYLLPGFIDIQVNGGGDVLFNDTPTVDGLRRIAAAHRRFGTTGLLPTLVSAGPATIARALEAVDAAVAAGVPGVLGIHVEGPWINPGRKGIHPAASIRTLDDAALDLLCAPGCGVRVVTLAPELAPPGMIERLVAAGVKVCAGHSLAGYDAACEGLARGVTGFTHLYNAMTGLGSREPGMVGAALDDRASRFGLIADGRHVHPAAMRAALRARGDEGVMLVTDAMPPVGGEGHAFHLGETEVRLVDGVLVDAAGTLGGSMLTMAGAVRNAGVMLGASIESAARMASGNAAAFLGIATVRGAILPGLAADLVHLDDDLRVTATWVGGAISRLGEAA